MMNKQKYFHICTKTGLWIRINLLRIRIQLFLNAEPDPAAFLMRIRKLPYDEFSGVEKNEDCAKVKKHVELAQIFFNLFNKITITTSTGTGINFLTFFQFFPQSFPTCIQEGKRMRIQPCPNKMGRIRRSGYIGIICKISNFLQFLHHESGSKWSLTRTCIRIRNTAKNNNQPCDPPASAPLSRRSCTYRPLYELRTC